MKFEETTIWTRSLDLAEACYVLCSKLPPSELFGLGAQIKRASTSVYANFAEGWSRETKRDSANFIVTARASLAELKAHLLFCVRRNWMTQEEVGWALDEIDQLHRILSAVRLKLIPPKP